MKRDNEFIGKLVSKAASGDQCAWSELYNETFRDAYFVAIKITNNEDNAIELVHDAFITAFDKVNQLEDKSKFQSWLNMIVANKCRDFLRKRKPVLFSDMETEDGDLPDWEDDRDDSRPEEVIDRQETVRLIAEIIESLPEDQKLCIMMYYWNEFSVSEIASSLEVSEGTVKSRLNYARIKIKAQVEELEKKGTKLYGLAPIPLLVWSLKSEASAMTIPASAAIAPAVVSSGVATATTAAGVVTATNSVAGAVTKSIMSGIVGKIVAGVLAVATIATVMTAVVKHNNQSSFVETNIDNHLEELSNQELDELNKYLTFFSEQDFSEYPCSDNELYDFAYVYNKINTDNVNVATNDQFEYAYSIEKNIIDTTLQGFFDRTVSVEDNEYRVLENDVYYQPAADGEGYNNFSIATSLQIANNEYTVAFDTYEKQYEFDSETLSEISKRQYVGSGYVVLHKHKDGKYKVVKYVGNNFSETEVYKLYEELLSKGKTENGLEITHYAFVNLDNDSIQELLVSNGNGTPDSMSEYELYTIREGKINFCAKSGSYYEYIYLINDDKYVLGCSRKGNEFISTDEKIALTSSWNESLSKYQSAISYNDGAWEEITSGEYSYYHIVSEYSDREGFIESREIINLQENTFPENDMSEYYSTLNGRYSGGGVKDPNSSIVIGQWHATISNATESSMNLAFVQSESDCFIEDMILYKQEDGSYYGTGETLSGKAYITINIKSAECISLSATGFVNQMGMEHLYKDK